MELETLKANNNGKLPFGAQSLAGHTSSISALTKKSPQLTKCKRDLLNQKERRRAAFAVEKDDFC